MSEVAMYEAEVARALAKVLTLRTNLDVLDQRIRVEGLTPTLSSQRDSAFLEGCRAEAKLNKARRCLEEARREEEEDLAEAECACDCED